MRYKRERLSCRRKKSVRQIKSNKLAGNRQQEIQTKRRETEMSETKNNTKVVVETDENEKDVVRSCRNTRKLHTSFFRGADTRR